MGKTAQDRIERLKKRIRVLEQVNRANQAQGRLFELLIEMSGVEPDQRLLKVSMQKTLAFTARLADAEMGSLFLLNEEGRVTDSLLTRGEVDPGLQSDLVGSVLDQGLAGWVRKNMDVGLIEDTATDPRWLSLPEEPYSVRSALAVPIIRHHSLFGIVTLMHSEPGHFTRESVGMIRMAANQMALGLAMMQLYIKSEEIHRLREKALERDLKLARQVQESFLPREVPEPDGYQFAAMNRPAQEVGGDLYHFFQLPRNRLGIAIGDVSGKGIAAALFMARLGSDLQYYSSLYPDPGHLLSRLNATLYSRAKQGMFVTLVYMVLDMKNDTLTFANAGHLPPLLMDSHGVRALGRNDKKGIPLGIVADVMYERQTARLPENACVILYTDGVVEAKSKSSKLFGVRRLRRAIQGCPAEPKRLIEEIIRAVESFSKDRGQSDDLTLVGFCRQGKSANALRVSPSLV